MDKDAVKMKKEVPIKRYAINAGYEDMKDWVVEEKQVIVSLNGEKTAVLLCTPVCLDELAVGHLLVLGKINGDSVVEALVQETPYTVNVVTGSRYEKGKAAGQVKKIAITKCLDTINELSAKSEIFRETGGVHSAALLLPSGLVFREDVGRHNAVDKLLGYCVLNRIDGEDAALFLSGRVAAEIVIKASLLNIPLIVSRSAVTSLAIEKAEEIGVTLVGFARGDRANIYAHRERID